MAADPNPLAHLWSWVEIHTGAQDEGKSYYGFFSGFGSDLSEITLVTGLVIAYRRIECHTPGCHRIGRHATADGLYKLCRKCHPDVANKGASLEEIHASHKAAKDRR